MKIALVAQHATPAADSHTAATHTAAASQAGDDTRLVEMSRSLAAGGHQVTVYARRGSAAGPERTKLAPGVTVEYVGPADSAADAGRGDDAHLLAQVAAFSQPLRERWGKDRPDVVHALRWTSGLAALSATRDLSVPVVQTFDSLGVAERRHGMIPAGVGTERIRLEPAIGRTVSAVMAVSSDEESDLTRLGVPRRSIRVVPTGVDTAEFSPEGPAYDRNDRRRLVAVADLATDQEGLFTLLRAVAKVPGSELVVAGGPPADGLRSDLSYRRLAKLADSLDLGGRVFFSGEVRHGELPPLLRSADLFVSVSEYDPSALAAIQAMACGTPVIAPAGGSQADAVVDGTTGVLVPPGRPALLAQRIRGLLAHPMQLEAFSVAAADRARSRYSWDRIANETLAVYDRALAA